jgi:putative ATPase
MELPFQEPPAPPLAERLRPRTLDEMIGQQHLLGAGKPLRVAFESGRLHSMILWGPPGVGKTTLARLVAQGFDAQFIAISAVLGGVKDIREAVERAQAAQAQGRRTVVFVDEVHRFNKAQQDAFLPHVESGLFTFIGATTENPSFEVNSALLSRATVHVLKPLEDADLGTLLDRAAALLAAPALTAAGAPAPDRLCRRRCAPPAERLREPDRDGRRARRSAAAGRPRPIDEATLEHALGEQLRRYDKGGEQFYDTISALHKAVRGSDPMPRCTGSCACSTAASTRATRRAGSSAWRARTSAWPTRAPAHRARRGRGLRAPRLARRRARAGRGGALPGGRAEEQRGLHAYKAAARSFATTAPGRCRCACATRRPR